MSVQTLKNNSLEIQVNESGAELISIKDAKTGIQYLWNGDPAYWNRRSPVLFPVVGNAKNKSYTYQGKTYSIGQHGFARDMMFTLKEKTEHSLWFTVKDTEDTLKIYPFHFELEIGYELIDRTIKVQWKVTNPDEKNMYFSIGGHPGFMCPLNQTGSRDDYYLSFDNDKPLHYLLIDPGCGLEVKKPFEEQYILPTDQGICRIDRHMFDNDALIIENHQCHSVSLLTPEKKPYVTVRFDAPLFGVWSPAIENTPFICIEPWYGRCDSTDFDGDLNERDYINSLQAGGGFEASYTIEIG